MSKSAEKRNIVVVGGGFAGTTVARHLQDRLPPGYALVLVSEESYTTFNPMLPEAMGASIFPEHVVAPLREILDMRAGHRFVMGRVTEIDAVQQTLSCASLAGNTQIGYAHLILAFGNRARLDFIPGMAEHALPLKTVGDAMEIRNSVLRRLAAMELEADAAKRRLLGQFLVVGGGFSGVEVAGELIDCLHSIQRYYPHAQPREIGVTLVHDGARLLPELPPRLGAAALHSLRQRGVQVLLNTGATEISALGVRLRSAELLPGATVICTIGTRPNSLTQSLGLSLERGRIVTRADMRVAEHTGLWALGDCALVPNAHDGQPAPPTAQFAVQQAGQLADNLLRQIRGTATRPFSHQARGSMAAIGHMKGVAQVFGLGLSGLPAWLLWRAYYLSLMPTWGRKLRIFVEWSWGMFFPADITHLRFVRSRDQG